MKTKVRTLVLTFIVLSLMCSVLTLGLGRPQVVASQAAPPRPLKIVLLGDSYAAGNGARSASGARNYTGPAKCYRSPTNWGGQYANWLKGQGHQVTFVNRACSGGILSHITESRPIDSKQVSVGGSQAGSPGEAEAYALANSCKPRFAEER